MRIAGRGCDSAGRDAPRAAASHRLIAASSRTSATHLRRALQALVAYGSRRRHGATARRTRSRRGGCDSCVRRSRAPAPGTTAALARPRARRRRCCSPRDEFERSLDVFPLEFGAILADHVVVAGSDPFDGARVDPADLRRACEVQAQEPSAAPARGLPRDATARRRAGRLIAASARAVRALLTNLARLRRHRPRDDADRGARHVERRIGVAGRAHRATIVASSSVQRISSADAERLFAALPRRGRTTLARTSTRWSARSTRSVERSRLSRLVAASLPSCVCRLPCVGASLVGPAAAPRADRARQRLRHVIDPASARRARQADPRAAGGQRRRRRRRHGADVPAVRRHPRVRRQDVREPRHGASARRARTTGC